MDFIVLDTDLVFQDKLTHVMNLYPDGSMHDGDIEKSETEIREEQEKKN